MRARFCLGIAGPSKSNIMQASFAGIIVTNEDAIIAPNKKTLENSMSLEVP